MIATRAPPSTEATYLQDGARFASFRQAGQAGADQRNHSWRAAYRKAQYASVFVNQADKAPRNRSEHAYHCRF